MAVIDSVATFVVSLLVGALGIYVGGRVITGITDYGYAVVTALIGALVWAIVGSVVGWMGPVLTLGAYAAVLNYRYPGGWVNAIAIALVAWIASLIVLTLLSTLTGGAIHALGVPGA